MYGLADREKCFCGGRREGFAPTISQELRAAVPTQARPPGFTPSLLAEGSVPIADRL